MRDLAQLPTWQKNFGLLPIRLSLETEDNLSYILLNGGYGDFCLNVNSTELTDTDSYYSKAWSSSTKNFVVLDSTNVHVFNWGSRKSEEIPKRLVEENITKFYEYLTLNNQKTSQDIVPYLIDIFKQFRNYTQERESATEALNLLFALLASIEDNISSLDISKWGINTLTLPSNFDQYIEKIKDSQFSPHLNLILRHSAGILFQEAQKEVLFFDRQIDLFGEYSSSLETRKNIYTSIHYTPSYLSRTIVENVLKNIDLSKPILKIFDPACGSAEFLIEILKQLSDKNFVGRIEITGWDSSESAINTATFLLTYEKRTIWHERLHFNLRKVNDSLQESWPSDFDAILMNPPFVSWEQLDKLSREAVNHALSFIKAGKPNQASAFFYKAIQSLNASGAIGCVVPSSLLTLDTYKELRSLSNDQFTIDLIGKLGNFVFEDALTDVSIIIGHRPKSDTIPYMLWVKNERGAASSALRDLRKMYSSNDYIVNESTYSIYQPHIFPIAKENWKPISYNENELLKKLALYISEQKLVKVQDIFNVKQGIRTGNNQLFKISPSYFAKLSISEQQLFRPAIENDSIKNCQLKITNYVWYPYSGNGIEIETEDELANKAPIFYNEKLHPNKQALLNRARKDDTNWWHLSEHRAWLRTHSIRLVSTEFGNNHSFALDKDGNFVVERGNAWIPKQDFEKTDYYYFYLALFSSPLFENLLSIYSRQLAGGKWYDLGNKYTKDIPIPNVKSLTIHNSSGYEKLVSLGKDMADGFNHSKAQIDNILKEYFYPSI